jgi:hypothetical protein
LIEGCRKEDKFAPAVDRFHQVEDQSGIYFHYKIQRVLKVQIDLPCSDPESQFFQCTGNDTDLFEYIQFIIGGIF